MFWNALEKIKRYIKKESKIDNINKDSLKKYGTDPSSLYDIEIKDVKIKKITLKK